MNKFELELWDDKGIECTFYTVRKDDAGENETDKSFKKYIQKLLSADGSHEIII